MSCNTNRVTTTKATRIAATGQFKSYIHRLKQLAGVGEGVTRHDDNGRLLLLIEDIIFAAAAISNNNTVNTMVGGVQQRVPSYCSDRFWVGKRSIPLVAHLTREDSPFRFARCVF